MLGGLIALALTIWGFVTLAGAVTGEGTPGIDERLLTSLRSPNDSSDPIGPRWVEEMARDVTALGSVAVLSIITAVTFLFLLLRRQNRAAFFVLTAVTGGFVASTLLKEVFDRPRPDLVAHATDVFTTSFPSAHSMMSAVTYLTLAALLAQFQSSRRVHAFLIAVGVIFAGLVGVSRVYLGVHWPSDVLAGWAAGGAWALTCLLIARAMQKSSRLDSAADAHTD